MRKRNNLEVIEDKINKEEYIQAEKLLRTIKVSTLGEKSKFKYDFLLAKAYFELDKNDLVMPTLKKLFEKPKAFPEIERAYLLVACLYMDEAERKPDEEKIRHLSEAESYFGKIENLNNLNDEEQRIFYFQKALLELNLNRVEKSISYFESALANHESAEEQSVLHSYLADAYHDIKEYDNAIEHYDLAIAKAPSSDDRNIAFLEISKARILDSLSRAYEAKVIASNLLGKYDSGKAQQDREISMYCNEILGYASYSEKEHTASVEYFKRASNLAQELGRDATHYLYECSKSLRALNDFENAEKVASEALAATESDTYVQLLYVELFRQFMYSDRYEKAIAMLQTLIEKYPDYEDLGWAYRMIGHMHSLLSKYDEAIEYFERSLEILNKGDGGRIAALDFTAYCYLKLGDIDKAMAICADIVQDHPDGPDLAWTHAVLARCYFEKGMKIQAQDEAEKAQKYKTPTSEVYSFAENVIEDILRDLGIQ